jgi:hypothetical protein
MRPVAGSAWWSASLVLVVFTSIFLTYRVVEAGQVKGKGRRGVEIDRDTTACMGRPGHIHRSLGSSGADTHTRACNCEKEFSVLYPTLPCPTLSYHTGSSVPRNRMPCDVSHLLSPTQSIHPSTHPLPSTQPWACVIADQPTHHPPSLL